MQHIGEGFGWCFEAEAFSRGVIVEKGSLVDVLWCECAQVCFARQESSQAAIGIFDTPFLPG